MNRQVTLFYIVNHIITYGLSQVAASLVKRLGRYQILHPLQTKLIPCGCGIFLNPYVTNKLNLMHAVHIIPLLPRLSPWPLQLHVTFFVTDTVLVGFLQIAGSLH